MRVVWEVAAWHTQARYTRDAVAGLGLGLRAWPATDTQHRVVSSTHEWNQVSVIIRSGAPLARSAAPPMYQYAFARSRKLLALGLRL